MDVVLAALNEVALDGLEGTTFDNLIEHLKNRSPPLETTFDDYMKEFIWNGLSTSEEVHYFVVDPSLVVSDVKQDKMIKSRSKSSGDFESLPANWIYDKDNMICGFSPSYDTRKEVSEEVTSMSLGEVTEKYGSALHLVGSQDLRIRTLVGETSMPELSSFLNPLRYTMLELIGKTRSNGLMQMDLKKFNFDPRSSFHHVKLLFKNELITKQNKVIQIGKGRSLATKILYLKSFHQQAAMQSVLLAEMISRILQEQPNCIMELRALKRRIVEASYTEGQFKKIRRWLLINGYLQYIYDGKVIPPDHGTRLVSSKPIFLQLIKMFEGEPDDGEIDEDSDDNYVMRCKSTDPILMNEMNIDQQAHIVMTNHKENGISVQELCEAMCIPHFWSRSLLNTLYSSGFCTTIMISKEKQRQRKLVSLMFIHKNETIKLLQETSTLTDLKEITYGGINDEEVEEKGAGKQNKAIENKDLKSSRSRKQVDQEKSKEYYMNKQLADSLQLRTFRQRGKEYSKDMKNLARERFIFDTIKSFQTADDAITLYKLLVQHEAEQGFQGRCCRKSFSRMLKRMESSNIINVHRFRLDEIPNKEISIYCGPDLQRDSEEVTKTIEQIKFRTLSVKRHSKKKKDKVSFLEEVLTPEKEPGKEQDKEISESDTDDEKKPELIKPWHRHHYEFLARFTRAKHLHLFIWQLVYGLDDATGNTPYDVKSLMEDQASNYDFLTITKRLPAYNEGKGWFKVADVIAIMPIVLFSQCGGIRVESKTFLRYLQCPRRRLLNTSQLPPKLTGKLLNAREGNRILASFIDCIIVMVQMGLVRVKAESLPISRSQIMLYLSTETVIHDTTGSERSYCDVILPPGVDAFPVVHHRFQRLDQVFKYWSELEFICLNTPLGYKHCAPKRDGKRGGVENPFSTLRDFKEFFKDVDVTACKPALIGDGLGAGGFDSSFFAHMNRNWRYRPHKDPALRKASKQKESTVMSPADMKPPELSVQLKTPLLKRIRRRDGLAKDKFKKRKQISFSSDIRGQPNLKTSRRLEDVVASRLIALHQRREAHKRKLIRGSGHRVDETDHEAMKSRRTPRAVFTAREDAFILQGVVAVHCMKLQLKQCCPWDLVRDMLHKEFEESKDKTIASVGRRARQLLKNSETNAVLKSCVVECTGSKEFSFSRNYKMTNWKEVYKKTIAIVRKKYKNRVSPLEMTFDFPTSYEKFLQEFTLKEMTDPKPEPCVSEPKNSSDISKIVLRDLVHNSIGGRYGAGFIPSIVYEVFKRYQSKDIDAAVAAMRKLALISRVRCDVPRHRCLPISTLRYDLSVAYDRIVDSIVPVKTYSSAKQIHKEMMLRLESEAGLRPCIDKEYNSIAGVCLENGFFQYDQEKSFGGLVAHLISLIARDELHMVIGIPHRTVRSKKEVQREEQRDGSSDQSKNRFSEGVSQRDGNLSSDDDIERRPGSGNVRIGIKRKRVSETDNCKKFCALKRVDSNGSRLNFNFSYLERNLIYAFQRTSKDTSHLDFDYSDKPPPSISSGEGDIYEEYQPVRKFFANINLMLQKADDPNTLLRPPAVKPEEYCLMPFDLKFKSGVKPFLEFTGIESSCFQVGSEIWDENSRLETTADVSVDSSSLQQLESDKPKDSDHGAAEISNQTSTVSVIDVKKNKSALGRYLKTSDLIPQGRVEGGHYHTPFDEKPYNDSLRKVFGYTAEDVAFNTKLLQAIKAETELGLTYSDALALFTQCFKVNKSESILEDHLTHLKNFNLVMEVGVLEKRYVANEFSLIWCIKTPVLTKQTINLLGGLDFAHSHVAKTQQESISGGQPSVLPNSKNDGNVNLRNASPIAGKSDDSQDSTECSNSMSGVSNDTTSINKVSNLETQTANVAGNSGDNERTSVDLGLIKKRPYNTDDAEKDKKEVEPKAGPSKKRPKLEVASPSKGSSVPHRQTGDSFRVRRISRLRPWLELNGELNPTVLKRFQMTILSYIAFNPGVQKDTITEKYSCLLRPVAVDDILEYLKMNQSITEHYMYDRTHSQGLFSRNNYKLNFANPYYLPTLSCIFNTVDVDRGSLSGVGKDLCQS